MSLPSSGSMTPRSGLEDVVGGGHSGHEGDSTGVARVNSVGGRSGAERHPDLRDPGEQARSSPAPTRPAPTARRRLDVLKALGDNTRYAIYLELARSPLPAGHRRGRRRPRPARQHRAAPPRAHARRRPARASTPRPAAASAGPSTAGRSPRRARRSASSPRRGPPSPACCSTAAAAAGSTPTTSPTPVAARAGPTPRSGPPAPTASTACVVEQARLGLRPRHGRASPTGPPWPSPTARSATSPRSTPQLVCALHCGLVEGFVDALVGLLASTASTPSSTARRARSTWCLAARPSPIRPIRPADVAGARLPATLPATCCSRRTPRDHAHRQRIRSRSRSSSPRRATTA